MRQLIELKKPAEKWEPFETYEVKVDWQKWPNSIFFLKNGEYFGSFDLKNRIYQASSGFWDISSKELEIEYVKLEMEYANFLRFMYKQIEKYFKFKVIGSWRWGCFTFIRLRPF